MSGCCDQAISEGFTTRGRAIRVHFSPLSALGWHDRRVDDGPRVGFTTPKGLGKAVVRNRIKRRMREAVRLELASLSPEWSIVFNPRRKALDCLFTELQTEVDVSLSGAANRVRIVLASSPGTNA